MAAYYSDSYLMTMLEQPWSSSFRTTFADCYSSSGVYSDMTMTKTLSTEALLHRTIADSPPQSDNVWLPGTTVVLPTPTTGNPESDGAASRPPQRNKKAVVGPTGRRVTKRRKSRASKRQATTFFETDPANFREMVQQVTGGVRFVGLGAAAADLADTSRGVDFDSFCSFPTLESSNLHF